MPHQRRRGAKQLAEKFRAQRLPAYHRANAANRNEIHSRYGSAAPEQQGHDPETLTSVIDGKRLKLVIARIGQRSQEEPVMITGHADTLTNLSLVCLFIF